MDAEQFIAELRHVTNSPEEIQKIREMIVFLAIHGKLNVGYSSTYEEALELVALTKEKKNNLFESGEIKKKEKFYDYSDDGTTDNVYPANWIKSYLGNFIHLISGQHLKSDEQNTMGKGIPYLTGASDFGKTVPNISRWTLIKKAIAKKGDLLLSVKGTIGKINVLNCNEAALGRQLMGLRPLVIIPSFLELILRNNEKYFINKSIGIAIPGISRKDILFLKVGLPGIEEQKCIVQKVNELMKLCDQLEKQQEKQTKLRKLSLETTLSTFSNAHSIDELKEAWNRIYEHFGLLLYDLFDVQKFRGLILDSAVKGLLVEQDPNEISAHELVKVITSEKAHLLKEKQISKQTKLPVIGSEEKPFEEPKGWTFVRLGQITNKIGSGSTPRGGQSNYLKEGIPFLRSQNIWDDGIKLDGVAYISRFINEKMANTIVKPKDILLNITGASLGRCALVPDDFEEANVSQHVSIIRPTNSETRHYLHLCILSPYFQKMVWGRQVGMAREGLSKKVLELFEIPLPPLKEQKRIVKKVNDLMMLCDLLEKQCIDRQDTVQKLVTAAVASITGLQIEEKEKMKVPKNELITKVKIKNSPTNEDLAPLALLLIKHNGELSAKMLWNYSELEIDQFYSQLKTEMENGWIEQPEQAIMKEIEETD